jgi:hypothetical protein
MAFTKYDLLLTPAKMTQLTTALANLNVADPLQYLCDEAAADVARFTAGYVLDANSVRNFTRSLGLYRVYSLAGPVPMDVQKDYDSALLELQAIAEGKRPNLPRAETGDNPPSGKWGSKPVIKMRTEP